LPNGLTVSGCDHATIGVIVRGEFSLQGTNHLKPVYKKGLQVDGLDVMLYFWDERDGANFCGWWFGPKVGGDQVWAYHPDKTCPHPPMTGWKMLYNGPIDQTLLVTPQWVGGAGCGMPLSMPPLAPAPVGPAPAGLTSFGPCAGNMQQRTQQLLEQKRLGELQKQAQLLHSKKDMEQRRVEEQKKQTATLAIRRVIQKARGATAETLTAIQSELAVTKAVHLENCGTQKAAILQECDKAIMQAQIQIQAFAAQKKAMVDKSEKMKAELEDRKRQMEENKKKIAENKVKLEEDMQRQKEDAIRKRSEDVKKAREAAMKKIEDDKRSKVEAEERKIKEHQTVVAVRKVLQKVRMARPEQFDEAKQELDAVLQLELDHCGSQKEVIQQEVAKLMEQAQFRIDKINEQRARQQEKRDIVMKLCSELEVLVGDAESAVVKLKESAAFFEDTAELSVTDVEEISQVIQEGVVESSIRLQACTNYIAEHGKDMKDPMPLSNNEPQEITVRMNALRKRIRDTEQASTATFQMAQDAKEKAMRHAWANNKLQEMKGLFTKYASSIEDTLTRSEITKYALGEFKFTVPEPVLDTIFRNIVPEGGNGVKLQDFTLLKAAIGVAREKVRDARKAEDREKAKVVFGAKIDETKASLAAASKVASKMDRQIQRLVGKVKTTPVPQMLKLADHTDGLVALATTAVAAASALVKVVQEALTPDMRIDFAKDTAQFATAEKALQIRVETAANLSGRFRDSAAQKQASEIERFRGAVLKIISYNQRTQSLNADQLFDKLDADGDGAISSDDFVKFVESAEKKLDDEQEEAEDVAGAKEDDLAEARKKGSIAEEEAEDDEDEAEIAAVAGAVAGAEEEDAAGLGDEYSAKRLAGLFSHLAEGQLKIPKDDFMRVIRTYYKCVKETVITDGMSIKESKPVRRLEVNEVLEIVEGPIKDDVFNVMRVQGRMVKDGLEGWISIAGNRGTVFLQRGGNLYKVVKETTLNHTLALEPGATTKTLPVGEVLEMHEIPRLDAVSGFTRMKAKVKSEGSVGWVTTMENPKNMFVQLL